MANPKHVKPREIREARAFLQKRGFKTADIAPKAFAEAAAELGASFAQTLKLTAAVRLADEAEAA